MSAVGTGLRRCGQEQSATRTGGTVWRDFDAGFRSLRRREFLEGFERRHDKTRIGGSWQIIPLGGGGRRADQELVKRLPAR